MRRCERDIRDASRRFDHSRFTPAIFDAADVTSSDDQVIKQIDFETFRETPKVLRDSQVLRAWNGVARRVVVNQKEARSSEGQRTSNDLSLVDGGFLE